MAIYTPGLTFTSWSQLSKERLFFLQSYIYIFPAWVGRAFVFPYPVRKVITSQPVFECLVGMMTISRPITLSLTHLRLTVSAQMKWRCRISTPVWRELCRPCPSYFISDTCSGESHIIKRLWAISSDSASAADGAKFVAVADAVDCVWNAGHCRCWRISCWRKKEFWMWKVHTSCQTCEHSSETLWDCKHRERIPLDSAYNS